MFKWLLKLIGEIDPKRFSPKELEAWINYSLPHVPGFYDCTERAEFAVKALERRGFRDVEIEDVFVEFRGSQEVSHAVVHYDGQHLGYGKGTILKLKK